MVALFPPKDRLRARVAHCAFALILCSASVVHAGELRIERTLLPDAAPSSFAVGFPNGVSFCYDVVRGGVSYIWQGGFVDLAPVRPEAGKAISPVKLLGSIVYGESAYSPLRMSDPQRGADIVFKGYRLKADAIVFIYEIDRRRVSEEIRATADGAGLTRRFRIEGASPGESWWYIPGDTTGGKLSAPGAARDGDGFRFDAGQDLLLEVHFEKAAS